MLVTSGQVSVAVSSGIVFLCTTALFLSGYVLQQRTLRDLRAAIKEPPRPSPKIFLPDRFKQSTTELADGTIIALDEDGKPVPVEPNEEEGPQVVQVVEIKPTLPGKGAAEPGSGEPAPTKTKTSVEGKKKGKGSSRVVVEGGAEEVQKPMSRAERRRRIKEEIQKSAQGERGYYRRLGCGEGGKC
ncbi:hypothetical protein F5144DRAFT_579293 [Chaetomium tenue]|uniref:Uncharacterized protein n=1 Tax=Chaetomium tenue TaxID=1854479 RepID=A0ACB7P3J1_9PEZI|nr:hypothetical protein F5144DRAFT_579293 [Chaetomium globosum]